MKTVLVLEDNPMMLQMYRAAFKRRPVRLIEAGSIAGAVQAAERDPPALLILDIVLAGGESGVDALYALRGGPAPSAPAIAVTTLASREESEWLAACGFNAHLAKPINLDALGRTVDGFLA